MGKSGRSKLSVDQQADADRAYKHYKKWKDRTGGTQVQIAARHFAGRDRVVWQLLKGWRPMNEDAAHKFALAFDVSMAEISPALARAFNNKVAAQRILPKRRNSGSSPELVGVQTPLARIKGIAVMNETGSWQWTEMLPTEGAVYWNKPGRYALRITGDAMHPRYKSGEYIIVADDTKNEPDTDVLILLKDGTAMIRELASLREGSIALRSIRDGERRTIKQDQVNFIHRIVGRADASEVTAT